MPPVRFFLASFVVAVIGSNAVAQFPPSYDDAPLRAVQFVDKQEGWAVGDHGVVWHTTDGGVRWERQKSGTRASLRAVHFLTPYTGFAVGRIEQPYGMVATGVVIRTTDGGLTWQEVAAGVLPGLVAVKFLDDAKGVVVGDPCPAFLSGVFKTTDGGLNWEVVPEKQAYEQLPVLGLERPTPGRTTEYTRKTGQRIPVHDLHMIDGKNGVAVGDLGTILATNDGGKTWTVRKCGGQRAAVLFVLATPDGVPLDTVALLGAKDGYYCQVLAVTGADREEQLHAAVRLCGGAGASAYGLFPTPRHLDGLSDEAILTYWNTLHAGEARNRLLRRLVLAIRTWQPEVVITDRVDASATGLEKLVMLAVRDAFKMAGDPAAFPDQLDTPGLKVHTPKKLYGKCDTAKDAMISFDHSQFCTPLGNDVKDFCEAGANLLGPAAAVPFTRGYRLVSHALEGAEKHTGLTEGLALNRGGTARREGELTSLPEPHLAYRQKMASGRRGFEALAANPDKYPEPDKFLAAVRKSLAEMQLPEDVACRTAFGAADGLARAGRWGLAREMYAFVADQFAAHPEAAAASRWLIQYHASSAVLRRVELGQVNPIPANVFETADPVRQVGHVETSGPAQKYRFASGNSQRVWYRYCLDLESRLTAFGPIHARDPMMAASLAVAKDRGAVAGPAAAKDADGKPAWNCLKAAKPTLDGQLTDECWTAAKAIPLGGTVGYEAEVRFAYDDQYLYVAVTAKHPSGKQVAKVEKRDRDADLRGHDRIEWMLDPDGTGATPFRFAVDHRGCLAEDCWGAVDWNPKWFVAFDSGATGWTAEIAIPMAEMTGDTVAGRNWEVNASRVVPGLGEPTTGWAKLAFVK